MKKKALLITTVSGFVPQFEMNNVHILEDMGYEIHYASNFKMPSYGEDNDRLDRTGIHLHQIDFCRSPYSMENRRAWRQLNKLMEQEQFELVHCHTPMGGALGRLAARRAKIPSIVYTAHGFHFFCGAPLINWIVYYPVELLLSCITDQLICINQEDFDRAGKFHSCYTDRIPGVGIDLSRMEQSRFGPEGKERKKKMLGIPEENAVLLSVGELIPRKNHEVIIRALKLLKNRKISYVICGQGRLRERLEEMARQEKVEKQVLFLGYREDAADICRLADLFLMPSLQEGLSVALMEAMACGTPVIASDIRGNRDLLQGGTGILVRKNRPEEYAAYITFLLEHQEYAKKMGENGRNAVKNYDIHLVDAEMRRLYRRLEERNKVQK